MARDAGVFEAEEQRLIPGQPVRRSGSPGGGGGKFSGSSSEFDCRVFQPGTGPTLFPHSRDRSPTQRAEPAMY